MAWLGLRFGISSDGTGACVAPLNVLAQTNCTTALRLIWQSRCTQTPYPNRINPERSLIIGVGVRWFSAFRQGPYVFEYTSHRVVGGSHRTYCSRSLTCQLQLQGISVGHYA